MKAGRQSWLCLRVGGLGSREMEKGITVPELLSSFLLPAAKRLLAWPASTVNLAQVEWPGNRVSARDCLDEGVPCVHVCAGVS